MFNIKRGLLRIKKKNRHGEELNYVGIQRHCTLRYNSFESTAKYYVHMKVNESVDEVFGL